MKVTHTPARATTRVIDLSDPGPKPARWPADGWSLGSLATSGPSLAWATAGSGTTRQSPAADAPGRDAAGERRPAKPTPEEPALSPWEARMAARARQEARARASAQTPASGRPTLQSFRPLDRGVGRPAVPELRIGTAAPRPSATGRPLGPAGNARPQPHGTAPRPQPARNTARRQALPEIASPEGAARSKPVRPVLTPQRPLHQPRPADPAGAATGPRPAPLLTETPPPVRLERRIEERPRHAAISGARDRRPLTEKAGRQHESARWRVIDLTDPAPLRGSLREARPA